MTETYREEVLEMLYQRHGIEFPSEDSYLAERFEQIDTMNATVEVAVEWLADDMAEMEEYR